MELINVDVLIKRGVRVRLVTLGVQLYKVVQAENELRKYDLENCITRCNRTLDGITKILSGVGIEPEKDGAIEKIRDSLQHIIDNKSYQDMNSGQDVYASPELKGLVIQNINTAYSSYERMRELVS